MERVKIFYGSREAAYELAMIDGDQHLVDRVLGWRGDPEKRTTMEFDVLFADGDRVVLTWTPDIHSTRQLEEYCVSQPLLYPLRFAAADLPKQMAMLRAMPIEAVKPGQDFYLDIRFYSTLWYDKLGLPDSMCTQYVVQARYVAWKRVSKGPPRIVVEVELFQERLRPWHNGYVCLYGTTHTLTDSMVLCDRNFALRYPQILPEDRRQQLLEQYKLPIPGGGGKVVLRHVHSGLLNSPHILSTSCKIPLLHSRTFMYTVFIFICARYCGFRFRSLLISFSLYTIILYVLLFIP